MLKAVLSLNMLSCLIFSVIFIFFSDSTNQFLGIRGNSWFIPTLGLVLAVFALHLASAILRKNVIKGEIFYFSIGDLLWVALTAGVLSLTDIIQSSAGIYSAVAVSLMVGTFGAAQLYIGRKLPNNIISVKSPTASSRSESWKVIKDFVGISRYHPLVKGSKQLTSDSNGVGAKRACEFHDGSAVEETVTNWQEGVGYTVEVSGMTMPVKVMRNQLIIKDHEIELITEFSFNGILNEVLMGFFMRPLLLQKLKKVVDGFANIDVTTSANQAKLSV